MHFRMVNLYEILKSLPPFSRQLSCRGMLFTNYDCPQTIAKVQFLVDCHFIAYVLSGRRIFHKNNKSWELKEGSCVFVNKGAHVAERENKDTWCVMVFFMPDHFLKELLEENKSTLLLTGPADSGSPDHVLMLDVNELSHSFFISMLPYFSQSPPPPESLLELKFKELVLSLLTNPSNRHFLSKLKQFAHEGTPMIEQVMLENYMYNLLLSDYAKLCCKSLPTFNREFRKKFNDTPARWILRKRLELAQELLLNTDMGMAEVGFECGFENQAHFSRIFKERTGISPLRYRLQYRRQHLHTG